MKKLLSGWLGKPRPAAKPFLFFRFIIPHLAPGGNVHFPAGGHSGTGRDFSCESLAKRLSFLKKYATL